MVGWGCIHSHLVACIRLLLVVNIFKIAIPLAAVICFSAVAPLAVAADSSAKKRSSTSAKKKSSSSKKSSKTSSKSAQSRKGKSKGSTAKKKQQKSERRVAKAETSHEWIDELPEVELPTTSGPAEEELLEPVDTVDAETEDDLEADPEP